MNNAPDSSHFLNAQLHTILTSFSNMLPKDAVWESFHMLINSLKFALLNGENPSRLSKRIRRERHRKEASLIPLSSTQAQLDIAEVKRLRGLVKVKPRIPGEQKLDRYRQEIVMLRQNGASQIEIKYWLFARKGLKVSQPTIHRYLNAIQMHG